MLVAWGWGLLTKTNWLMLLGIGVGVGVPFRSPQLPRQETHQPPYRGHSSAVRNHPNTCSQHAVFDFLLRFSWMGEIAWNILYVCLSYYIHIHVKTWRVAKWSNIFWVKNLKGKTMENNWKSSNLITCEVVRIFWLPGVPSTSSINCGALGTCLSPISPHVKNAEQIRILPTFELLLWDSIVLLLLETVLRFNISQHILWQTK